MFMPGGVNPKLRPLALYRDNPQSYITMNDEMDMKSLLQAMKFRICLLARYKMFTRHEK